ncbi:hypothetical protein EDB87DRAFT_1821308 [Lactarius vividus]|nr:hypothetical protein EDB87DRAFT_1821308 [Lactarius vividus]
MDKRNLGDPMVMVLLWPWWKAKKVGRGKHTDIDTTVDRVTDARSLALTNIIISFHEQQKASPRNIHILPALPLEIVDSILREACEWPLRRAERQILTSTSLVCKYCIALPTSLGVPEHLKRKHFSSDLIFWGPPGRFPFTSLANPRQPSRPFPKTMLQRGLRYVELSVDLAQKSIGPFEPHILGWLSSLVLPIEVLNFDDWGLLHSTFVYDLVGIWPTIRALRVLTRSNGLLLERPSINLRELKLPTPSLATAVIEWLLPPPPPNEQSNLQFLELYNIADGARTALSVHEPSVSTLTLWRRPAFEIGHLFTKLEELVIAGPLWRSTLSAFPKTLKHIRIHVPGFMSDSAVPAVARMLPTLPDLRVLSIENGLTSNEHYPDLQEACETHRVEILRWTAFLDNTHAPNSLLGIEDSEKGVRPSGCDAYQLAN